MGIFIVNNVPIVTPNITSHNTTEPDVCPECRKTGPVDIYCLDCEKPFDHGCARNVHEFTFVCQSCGNKYEIDDDTTPGWVFTLQVVAFIVWADQSLNDPKFDKSFLSYLFEKLSHFWRRVILKLI